ncbi:MAG: T9SS type A sorting domain-containing protein [Ignavibacteria bacterium]|nr:T9SS type A sorting domain-containing protein [Ignavibacteria bacterium]
MALCLYFIAAGYRDSVSQVHLKPPPFTGLERKGTSGRLFEANQRYGINALSHPVVTANPYVNISYLPGYTYYDVLSNGAPQNIWQDPVMTSYIHAAVMTANDSGLGDLDTRYFLSTDRGQSWEYLGTMFQGGPPSLFPAISGMSSGAAIVSCQNAAWQTPVRTKIFYDQGAGFGSFTQLDPSNTPGGPGLWPRIAVTPTNNIVFVSSPQDSSVSYTNSLVNLAPPGTFTGYVPYTGDNKESYALAVSDQGVIGHAYLGSDNLDPNDLFYRQSTDNGISWSIPLKIWDWNPQTDSIGCYRSVSMVFSGHFNSPCVVFTTSKLTETGFFPELPSKIRFWSPAVNSGVPLVIADNNYIPFYPNTGNTSDGYLPLCRPVIGRPTSTGILMVAFLAATEHIGSDSSRYYAVYGVTSCNAGMSFQFIPGRLTPLQPLRDWRYLSISPKNYGSPTSVVFQMLCLSDSAAGPSLTGSPAGRGQIANIRYEYYCFDPPPFPPGITYLNSPPNGSINMPLNPVMSWIENFAAEYYELKIARDSNFTDEVLFQSIPAGQHQFQVPLSILINNVTYYWKVRAANSGGNGPYSSVWSFATTPVVITSISTEVPDKFELYQNYPNPFNPSTRIRFGIPATTFVSLDLIDISGRIAMKITGTVLQPGMYEVLVDAGQLPSGSYLCRMTASGFIQTRKIVLIK